MRKSNGRGGRRLELCKLMCRVCDRVSESDRVLVRRTLEYHTRWPFCIFADSALRRGGPAGLRRGGGRCAGLASPLSRWQFSRFAAANEYVLHQRIIRSRLKPRTPLPKILNFELIH